MTNNELIEIYKKAKYIVMINSVVYRLRIGRNNPEIDKILDLYGVNCAYFITPENPFSQSLSETENKLRHQRFVDFLKKNKLQYIDGYGTDEEERWEKEYSYLIFCEQTDLMHNLAANFGQKGFLKVSKNTPVSLLTLESMRYQELS